MLRRTSSSGRTSIKKGVRAGVTTKCAKEEAAISSENQTSQEEQSEIENNVAAVIDENNQNQDASQNSAPLSENIDGTDINAASANEPSPNINQNNAPQETSNGVPSEQQVEQTWMNFITTHGYENPTTAVMQAYQNPSMANIGNVLMDPVVAGTIIATAAGAYLYTLWMQYAKAQVQKAEEEKEETALQE